jgi:hypothetical protein
MTSSLEARSPNLTHFDSTRPQYVPGSEPDFVVPVQFYDLIRRSAFLDGETRLVFAVLEDAVRTYLRVRDSHRRRDRVEFAEVARWFEARTGAVPFSFEYVCEVLGLEPGLFRKQLRVVQPHVLPTKQLRSVGRRQRVRSIRYAKKCPSWQISD